MNLQEAAATLWAKHPELTEEEVLERSRAALKGLERKGKNQGKVFHKLSRDERLPLDEGPRDKGEPRIPPGPPKRGESKPRIRLSPTNSERLNRALVELSDAEFKELILLWKWRGAPGTGPLSYFTVEGVARHTGHSRRATGMHLQALKEKGWIRGNGYNEHWKKELYWLAPIETVPKPGDPSKEARS